MSAIISAVFKATIGLIVDKGRDVAAERLKEGDVVDQKFRSLIVRDLKEIHYKLDALSQKDLNAAIDFFETDSDVYTRQSMQCAVLMLVWEQRRYLKEMKKMTLNK